VELWPTEEEEEALVEEEVEEEPECQADSNQTLKHRPSRRQKNRNLLSRLNVRRVPEPDLTKLPFTRQLWKSREWTTMRAER
jgi:hypothetical protein